MASVVWLSIDSQNCKLKHSWPSRRAFTRRSTGRKASPFAVAYVAQMRTAGLRSRLGCSIDRPSAKSFSRASNRRYCGVCGKGLNSPLEIIRVGTGERNAARSAGFVCANSRSRTPSSSSPHSFSAPRACERQDRFLEMFVADRKRDRRSRGAGSQLNDITRA